LNEAQPGAVLLALPVGLMLAVPVTGMLLNRLNCRIIWYSGPTGRSSRCFKLIDFFY
jgi:hypothetical protein